MPKISVITPSCRPDGLDMVKRCLTRQSFKDFEWIVVSPFQYYSADLWISDPPKIEGQTYALNRAWNSAFKQAKGELIVSIVDLLWFSPDILDYLWAHYALDKKSCIGGIGHQYERMENGKPEGLVWNDPRVKNDPFHQIPPMDFELCVASLPLQGIKDVGGVDEKFDLYAALSEKELCIRMGMIGYTFWLDQTIEYRAIKHDRLTEDWDEKYKKGCEYFNQCIADIKAGRRLKLNYI